MRRFCRPPGRPIRSGGVSSFAIVLLVALLSVPLIFASVQTGLRRSNPKPIDQNQNDIFAGLVEEDIGWRGKLAKEYLKSLFSEKATRKRNTRTVDAGQSSTQPGQTSSQPGQASSQAAQSATQP